MRLAASDTTAARPDSVQPRHELPSRRAGRPPFVPRLRPPEEPHARCRARPSWSRRPDPAGPERRSGSSSRPAQPPAGLVLAQGSKAPHAHWEGRPDHRPGLRRAARCVGGWPEVAVRDRRGSRSAGILRRGPLEGGDVTRRDRPADRGVSGCRRARPLRDSSSGFGVTGTPWRRLRRTRRKGSRPGSVRVADAEPGSACRNGRTQ